MKNPKGIQRGSPERRAIWASLFHTPIPREIVLDNVRERLGHHLTDRDFREIVQAMIQDGVPILTTLAGYQRCFRAKPYHQAVDMLDEKIIGLRKRKNAVYRIAERLGGQRKLNLKNII